MKELPDVLSGKELIELAEQKRVLYFNHLGNLNPFSNLSKEGLLKVLKGKSHALVDNHLYVDRSEGYMIKRKDWLITDEGRQYLSILKKMCSNK